MSLYYEAAPLLSATDVDSSLKSRAFTSKNLKSTPKQLFALLSEAAKWSPILTEVIEKSQLLQLERKLSPSTALLLVHDLLLTTKGISAPASHPLRVATEKHKARLSAEFTKLRLKRGFASTEGLQAHVNAGGLKIQDHETAGSAVVVKEQSRPKKWLQPRWVRVNTLKTTLHEQMITTFAGYKIVDSVEDLLRDSWHDEGRLLHVDEHIPDLVAIPPDAKVVKTAAYLNGLVILQDKASCFPAYLLDPNPQDGYVLDACAAPGNKTTHIGSILHKKGAGPGSVKIYACEREKARAQILGRMVDTAGASQLVSIKVGQDFLRLDPQQAPWKTVGSLLLDPSCSGSGMVGREEFTCVLPSRTLTGPLNNHRKKRKRKATPEATVVVNQSLEVPNDAQDEPQDQLAARLSALSFFQSKLLSHAFTFPKARRIVYSTCSVYREENECVVAKALLSEAAQKHGWRMMRREEQITGMRAWRLRGDAEACKATGSPKNVADVAEACIRCEKGTKEGTQGFFMAAFIRDEETSTVMDDEWHGFDD